MVITLSFDGIFIHYLIEEIIQAVKGARIKKVISINKTNFVFELSSKRNLLISSSADSSHFRLIEPDYLSSGLTFPFFNTMKRHLESGIITNIYQTENDRLTTLSIENHDALGYIRKSYLILEMFGRNSNLIILNDNFTVIDCLNKTYLLTEKAKRIMTPKIEYTYPTKPGLNPFKTNEIFEENIYQGTSTLAFREISHRNDISFLKGSVKPTMVIKDNKAYFYCFELTHINGITTYFPTLSDLLLTYYVNIRSINIKNTEQKNIENYLKKELLKTQNKLKKQQTEYKEASENLFLEQTGNILAANLYKIQKNTATVTVFDFYNNLETEINLDPRLSPAQNMEAIYARYKKAKRTITHLYEQMAVTEHEISYLQTLEEQLQFAGHNDVKEIISELSLGKTLPAKKRSVKPAFSSFHDNYGNIIMVGKNNVQNNYLTHKVASKTDIFFHVRGVPGSHVIFRGNLDEDAIILTASLAAYYSKSRFSENVPVDYTLVRYVKKIPGMKGSFVSYKNEKTIFVTPNSDFIKAHIKEAYI